MKKILKDHLDEIAAICRQHHVQNLFAFGSVNTNKFSKESDIDLYVSFVPFPEDDYADNYFSLQEHLQRIFSRDIDLVTENMVKTPIFRTSIEKSRTQLYG